AIRLLARRGILRIRRRAFQPDVAAVEMLALPDRHDLLHALDRVAARGERIAAMRRRRRDDDARFADLEAANPMMRRNAGRWPELSRLADDELQRPHRERFVRLVLEKAHPSPEVVVADQPRERD